MFDFDFDISTILSGLVISTCLAGCTGDATTTVAPIVTATPAPITVTTPIKTGLFSEPQKIEGISISEKITKTTTGFQFEFGLERFYYANGVLSVLPIFFPQHAVNADPTLLGKNSNVYMSEYAYSLNGLTATRINSVASVSHPNALVTADFNGDGRDDVFIADHGYDAAPWPGGQNTLLLSTATGGFVKGNLPQMRDFSHSTSAADINGDGSVDILVGNMGLPMQVRYFLINDGKGNFTQNYDLIKVSSKAEYASSALIDINKDGKMDLILGGKNNGSELLSWNGKEFVVKQSLYLKDDADRTITTVSVADLDNDGTPEIVFNSTTQNPQNFYNQNRIDIFKADANGNYAASQQIQVSTTRWNKNLYVTDVNEDGYLDLVSLGRDSKIYLNDHGSFVLSNYALPFEEWVQATGMLDLNNDGRLDLIYTQFDPVNSSLTAHVQNVYVAFG